MGADAQAEDRIYLERQRQLLGNAFDVVTNATDVRTPNAQITLQMFEGLAIVRGLFGLLAIFGNEPLVIPDQSGDLLLRAGEHQY